VSQGRKPTNTNTKARKARTSQTPTLGAHQHQHQHQQPSRTTKQRRGARLLAYVKRRVEAEPPPCQPRPGPDNGHHHRPVPQLGPGRPVGGEVRCCRPHTATTVKTTTTTTKAGASVGLGLSEEKPNSSLTSIARPEQLTYIATDSLASGHHEQEPRRVNDRRARVTPDRVHGGKRIGRHFAEEVTHRSLQQHTHKTDTPHTPGRREITHRHNWDKR